MPLRKPSVSSVRNSTEPITVSLGEWGKKYPLLCEFLSSCTWEDGSSRELGSLILFYDREVGAWKACLSCKDTSRVAFVSGEVPQEVLGAAERGLAADKLDWRAAKPRGRSRGS